MIYKKIQKLYRDIVYSNEHVVCTLGNCQGSCRLLHFRSLGGAAALGLVLAAALAVGAAVAGSLVGLRGAFATCV